MSNGGAGPERLMGGIGEMGTTGGTGRAPAIVGLVSCIESMHALVDELLRCTGSNRHSGTDLARILAMLM